MRTRILGLVAGVALLGGSAALAQDSAAQQQTQDQSLQTTPGRSSTRANDDQTKREGGSATVTVEPGTGGAGQSGQAQSGQAHSSQAQSSQAQSGQVKAGQSQQGAAAGASASAEAESTLTGTVVKADRSMLFVRTDDGAVVPLKVDKKTQFADPSLKSAKDLKEGQQVRASFTVKKTDNLATKLEATGSAAQGTGGAGSWSSQPSSTSGSAGSSAAGTTDDVGSSAAGTTGSVSTEPSPTSQPGSGAGVTPDDGKQKK